MAQSGSNLCNQLLKLDDAQAANPLLRKCQVPRLTFWSQPQLFMILKHSQPLVVLFNMGGFGLTSLASVSHPAFVVSWAHAAVELPFRFQSILPSINSFVKSSDGPIGRVCLNVSWMTCLSAIVCWELVSCSFSFPNTKLE